MKKNNLIGLTAQGVRDLSFIKGKRVAIRLAPVPEGATCSHTSVRENGNHTYCPDCQMNWDNNEG